MRRNAENGTHPRSKLGEALTLTLTLILTACAQPADGDLFQEVAVEQAVVVPTVFAVRWDTPEAVEGHVRFGEVGGSFIYDTPLSEASLSHEAVLVGVPEASEGWFELVVMVDGEEVVSSRYEFTTGQLSADIPRPFVSMGDSESATPGLILAPIALSYSTRWTTLMDHHGRLVWAWGGEELDTQRARLSLDGQGVVMMDRNLEVMDLVSVDFFGEERWRMEIPYFHHDFELITDESFLVLQSDLRDVQLGGQNYRVNGDSIRKVGLDGEISPFWSIWDHLEFTEDSVPAEDLDPAQEVAWTHGNYLHFDEAGDQILTTMRNIGMAFSIDRQSGAVNWSLGDPGGTYTSAGETPVLKYPHSIWPTETGYTVFNQGLLSDGDCSWAAHLELDPDTSTADSTWTYASPTCNQVSYLGNAQPLGDDRALVSFGKAGVVDEISTSTGETVVRYSLDAPSEFLYIEHVGGLYPPNP